MAVFTALDGTDAQHLLAHYALGTLVSLEPITAGIENTNYFLTTTGGRYVLTVFERLTAPQLPFYLELMRHLAAAGLPVPAPSATHAGALMIDVKGKPATIVARLPGQALLQPAARHCAQVGEFLARMHEATVDFPIFQPHSHGIGWWKEVLPKLAPHLPEDALQELTEEVIYQDAFFRSPLFERLARGPIHADLFRDNVLFDGERIGGVIDFYFAGCSIRLFDVAVAVNDWCVDLDSGAFDEPRAQALLRAYDAVRPFSGDERLAWRSVLRAAALRFWMSRLDDLHRPRPARLLQPHDPSRFERMLRLRIASAQLPWI